VYLFAKNKARLLRNGILAVVPEPELLRVPMDKALTLQAAERVGFPCAKTFYPREAGDVDRILEVSRPPWIVKPRFTAHGARMVFAQGPRQLRDAVSGTDASRPWPIVQEYISGGRLRMYNVVVGRDSEILTLLSPECVRSFAVGYRVSHRTTISGTTGPFLPELRALIRELRLWGPYTIQTKVDPQDGLPKLLEINARFGNNLWRRTVLGVNEPLIVLRLAQGRPPGTNLVFREGVIQLEPISDFLYLAHQLVASMLAFAQGLRGRRDSAAEGANINPRGVLATLQTYRPDYFNRRPKVYKPDSGNLLVDPWPCLRFFWHSIVREATIRLNRTATHVVSSSSLTQ
jgi:predicted ATP-grasp superfamily ATP-dependent carboligase